MTQSQEVRKKIGQQIKHTKVKSVMNIERLKKILQENNDKKVKVHEFENKKVKVLENLKTRIKDARM